MKLTSTLAIASSVLMLSGFASAQSNQDQPDSSKFQGAVTKTIRTEDLDSARVSVQSKGTDLKLVIASVMEQCNQQYVIQLERKQGLYLSIDNARLDVALDIISNLADVTFKQRRGIWYITQSKKKGATTNTAAQGFAESSESTLVKPKPAKKSKGLASRLTTKLVKTNIREVFAFFSKKTGVEIEVAEDVPNYKIDAYMVNTSLKFALDRVAMAAHLTYDFSDGKTVRISKA